jgi:hypothetical protein
MWDWNGVMECVDWIVAFYGMGKLGAKDTNTSVCGHFLEGFWDEKGFGLRYDMIMGIF